MTTILDGKSLAEKIYTDIAKKVSLLSFPPKLVVIFVGNHSASSVYVQNKEKACEKSKILSEVIRFPEDISEESLLAKISELNKDKSVSGIIVQLPLPSHISPEKVIHSIDPKKDADGFHPTNLGEMLLSKQGELLPPATPGGIIRLLEEYKIDVSGLNAVVVGRSNIVGKPIASMLLNRDATVTICHSKTKDISSYTSKADLLIAAVGKSEMITGEMVKQGAIVIDVGIHRKTDGLLCGDVDFKSVAQKASFITPVPGGVGPMTVATLIENAYRATLLK
jgi:methylenetetrahydrofolate dehydrogenase (NADP+) / methenyltetrahydrofolate cyclohydrolase